MADTQDVIVKNDSAERVAFELMEKISAHENVTKDTTYFLTLYSKCYKATHGYSLKDVFQDESQDQPRRY
jgi:hypothetical protein